MNDFRFEPVYPDVLGAITGGTRINLEHLQCALGVFPQQTYLNQPVEIVLILQNMVDQMMQVKVNIQMPKEDRKGRPIIIDTPRKMVTLGLRPGEVGVLHTPVVPKPPTSPGNKLPVRVAVRYRTARPGKHVRPFTGGPPPSIVAVSPFKLQVLQDVQFSAETWHQSTDILTTYFDIAPKVMPDIPRELQARYEALWTHEEMQAIQAPSYEHVAAARRVASGLTRTAIYLFLLDEIEERYAARGIPLHPGEAVALAKMLTYTLDEGLELEPGFDMESSQWFQVLCQVLAYDEDLEDMDRGELAAKYLFEPAFFDAIILAFSIIEPKVRIDLGTEAERVDYANRAVAWLAGQGEPDLSYVYLPLAMGAILVNELANVRPNNPWTMLEELKQALQGRRRLLIGEKAPILNMTNRLLALGEDMLRRSRVDRP